MKKTMIISGACLTLLFLLFMVTDPADVPSFMLVLPFVLLFIVLLSVFSFVLQSRGVSARKSWRVGALGAAVPLTLLILQSIGQLTVRDVLTIAALFLLSYFYISRTAVSS